eukprot:357554-Chlamydomonas_euryale.AAC.5
MQDAYRPVVFANAPQVTPHVTPPTELCGATCMRSRCGGAAQQPHTNMTERTAAEPSFPGQPVRLCGAPRR